MDEQEKTDRQMGELLQELRVALPGVQILFAFLLTVPFAQGFQKVTSFQRTLFFVTLLATALSAVCFIAPGARALETAAMVAYCAPVFFVGLFVLWMFNPIYGLIPLPAFFDAEPRWIHPWNAPWDWFRTLLVPWIVLGAPLGAMCLRLTLAETREAMDEDFVRTAAAKGVAPRRIVRRHAAPLSFPGTFSFVGVAAPLLITNMVLVERTMSVPGFFKYTWRASGHANPGRDPVPDFPTLCALGLWAAVLLIVLGVLADGIVALFDPRVRTSPARAW